MHPRTRAVLFLILGLALLTGLLVHVGPMHIVHAIEEASPIHLFLAFCAYAVFFMLRGLRWKLLFSRSAPDVRLVNTTSISAVGWLANSILPLKSGDVLRAALLARRESVGLATSAATVGLERVLDLIGVALVAALGLMLVPRAASLPEGLARALTIAWILPLAILLLLAIVVRWRLPAARAARAALRPLGKLGEKLATFGEAMLAGLAALVQQPALLARLAPLTIAVSLAQTLIFTFLVMAFLRTPTFMLAFSGSAIFLLSFVVSITPGNVGTYEAAFASVFIALGVAPEVAVPAAILTHVTTTLCVALLGGIGLFLMGTTGAADPGPQERSPTPQGGSP